MALTYLYLDDEDAQRVRPFIRAVTRFAPELNISLEAPQPYREQIQSLGVWQSPEGAPFNGLILDLRLDMYAGWRVDDRGERADYRATTLAQEIRTRAAETSSTANRRGAGEYPIVLWSMDRRLDASYNRDHTSHDLFDLICVKEDLTRAEDEVPSDRRAPTVAQRLVALATGYEEIVRIRDTVGSKRGQFFRYLGFDDMPNFLDERLSNPEPFDHGPTFRPAHEYARFVRQEMLEVPGPLIDRHTFAARLGIDLSRSSDFERLVRDHFATASYLGPFREGWPRWWAGAVESVLVSLVGGVESPRTLSAKDRVRLIRTRTKLRRLVAAEPLPGGSDRFWVACRVTGQPLDPRDGFVLRSHRSYAWQSNEYVSLPAILEGSLRDHHLRLDPREERRVELAKARVRR